MNWGGGIVPGGSNLLIYLVKSKQYQIDRDECPGIQLCMSISTAYSPNVKLVVLHENSFKRVSSKWPTLG